MEGFRPTGPVWIMDMAAVTALGDTLDALWPRLLAGESAIAPVTRFDTARLEGHAAACVADLERGAHPNLTCALMARCLDRLGPVPPDTFVIWAGVKSDAEWIEANVSCQLPVASCQKPELATGNSYRRWIAERLRTTGAGLELNAACASSAAALALGAMMIRRGQAAAVLVCAADLVTRFTFTGFAALRALTPAVCRPLDAARDGLALGDGAAAMLLMSDEALRAAGARPLARLAGWGLANDATHITAPARDGRGLIAAIRQSLTQSVECGSHAAAVNLRDAPASSDIPHSAFRIPHSAADEVVRAPSAWCVHGTGTVYNDAMELTALESVFGARRFPIFSIKGAVGHTLGAAGALEAAICIKALQHGIIPPTAGLATPEPRAAGRAAAAPQPFAGSTILTTNSGFGGVNAALVLERAV